MVNQGGIPIAKGRKPETEKGFFSSFLTFFLSRLIPFRVSTISLQQEIVHQVA